MKFTVRGHEYSIEWLSICAGLFLSSAWLLILYFLRAGELRASDIVSDVAFFFIGFSATELLGAIEILKLWREENDAFQAEACLRQNKAAVEAQMYFQQLKDLQAGKSISPDVVDRGAVPPRQIVIHHAGQTRTIEAERNLTDEEWALGNALQSILLWAWHTGDITSGSLVGRGKPISETEDWQHLTDRLSEMGFVRKGNGVKTEMVTTYAHAVGSVFDRLSMVSTKDGHKAKVAPPPQDAWKKSRSSAPKA